MNEIINRKTRAMPLWEVLEERFRKKDIWGNTKTVCVLNGLAGCGKTTYILHYFKNKKVFYFSFAGLDEALAELLFCERVAAKSGVEVSCWADAFRVISANYKTIIFDDLSSVVTHKHFKQAFYDNMITNVNTRPFVVLIAQPTDDLSGLADYVRVITLDYFSVPEVMKLYPDLSKYDALKMTAITDGISKIMHEYNSQSPISPSFMNFMPELLSKYFRRPENYHRILHAIAHGNHNISNIGKFTGFAHNKCDNYLIKLIECGFVKTNRSEPKPESIKTQYRLSNNYFKLWYKYVFENQTAIALGENVEFDLTREAHDFHVKKAFDFLRKEYYWCKDIAYSPQIVDGYKFDAVIDIDGKTVFVKIFESPDESCTKTEILKIQEAVMRDHVWYDCHVFIFTKRRFSDFAVNEAAMTGVVRCVGLERLG